MSDSSRRHAGLLRMPLDESVSNISDATVSARLLECAAPWRRRGPRRACASRLHGKLALVHHQGMGRASSDEAYVIGLCSTILGEEAVSQHRFDWLLGDPGADGRRVRLPVDGYWPGHRLVVEYRELQHDRPVPHFDKPDRLTVSGVHRGRQRAIYDARRDTEIPAHGLRLVVIRPSDLDADSRGRLRRDQKSDLVAIRRLLAQEDDDGSR
ncbi:hypothetical protein ACQP1W_30675 [Spirillospora sp. CA-255316]